MSEGSFLRRRLGVRLRRLRESCNPRKTTLDVESSGVCSRMTLYRIELGLQATKQGTVVQLCQLYGADPRTTNELVAYAKASRGSGWFEAYGDVIPKGFGLYLDCEPEANKISIYDSEVIPGALQTPDYAEAIFIGEGASRAEVDRQLVARLERQARYWAQRPSDARLHVVLNQGALARQVVGHVTMGRQLDRLREIGEWDEVEIRVLPWSAGAHAAIYGSYTIFQFADSQDPDVIYLENYFGGRYIEEGKDVTGMLGIHQSICHSSVPIKEYSET